MIGYHLNTLGLYLVWAFGGYILHIFKKLAEAKKSKGEAFEFKIFMKKNLFGYLASLVAIILLCGLLAISTSQLHELPPIDILGVVLPYQTWLIIIGYSGGSALKNLLNKKVNG